MIGTPLKQNATKLLLLGSGELGKEVLIEAQRLGLECIAVDSYDNAPAHQVAHRRYVVDMKDGKALRQIIEKEKPDYIVPEIEAIDTAELELLQQEGFNVVPTAHAVRLTMDREGIRRMAAEELKLPTAKYMFAETIEEFRDAVKQIGIPCVTKPIMSSSGKGQSTIKSEEDIDQAFSYAKESARGNGAKIIIEEFVKFDYEITLLTVRTNFGTFFCEPIGHVQISGDYHESWQPAAMSDVAKQKAQEIAKKVTDALGGNGLFGVELFVCGENVIFSEVSPRPHDTGMVTMVTQWMSEFELHVRAILGLPVDTCLISSGASHVVKAAELSHCPSFDIEKAAKIPNTKIRLFGKPITRIGRRMAVALTVADSTEEARKVAEEVAHNITIKY